MEGLPEGQCREALVGGIAFELSLRKTWTEPAYAPHVGAFDLPLVTPAPYTGDGADPGTEMSAEANALAQHLEAHLVRLVQERAGARWPDPVTAEVHATLGALVIMVGQAIRADRPTHPFPPAPLN